MKNFKETFKLIDNRIRNLKGMILSVQNAKDEGIAIYQNEEMLKNMQEELDALILQDSQLRDFIINEK
jgi:hypothetical protein